MFEVRTAGARPGGSFRLGLALFGLLVAGLGVLVIAVPEVIAYALGGLLVLFGGGLVLSAIVFRGPPRSPFGARRDGSDFEVVVEPVED